MTTETLWTKLVAEDLSDLLPAAPGDPSFARQTVEEYRRFLYLCGTEPGEQTPSVTIDTIWHAHLEDPTAYAALCERVFGRPIDHRPAKAPADAARHRAQYRKTLERYAEVFGTPPPRTIWPTPNVLAQPQTWMTVGGCGLLLGLGSGVGLGFGHPLTLILLLAGILLCLLAVIPVTRPGATPAHGGCGAVVTGSGKGYGGSNDGGAGCGGGGCGGGGG